MNRLVFGLVAAAVAFGATACEDGSKDKGSDAKATASKETGKDAGKAEEKQSTVDAFKAFVGKHGTANEKAAVKHVVKVQGADENNDLLDAAEIHTDYKGDMMDSSVSGAAKLLASSFADFQKDRGKDSKNGLVSVYNAAGDLVGNGKY
ncbi:hypothetical protein ACFPC0_11005 [Streptomyces andamanensis]|uniref:Lipoprotein n=1 Tax=Streptomyces andamanensis TaxID=1565035 RepID=A0ABV8TCR5_9ACTN